MAENTFPSLPDLTADSLQLAQETKKREDWDASQPDWLATVFGLAEEEKKTTIDPFESFAVELVEKAGSRNPQIPKRRVEYALNNLDAFIALSSELEMPEEWARLGAGAFEQKQEIPEHKIDEWEDLDLRDFTLDNLLTETDVMRPRPNALQWAVGSFFENVHPIPTAVLSEEQKSKMLPEPETPGEIISSLVGGIPGMAVGMQFLSIPIGGVTAPGYADKAKKAVTMVNKIFKLQKTGKGTQAKNLFAKAQKAGKFNYVDEKGIVRSLLPGVSGMLGESNRYANFILKTAEKSPKLAKALDAGVRNMIVFPAYGQIKVDVPFSDLKNRGKQATMDVLTSFMFTAASSPQILEWSKMAQHTVTPTALFMIGAGADIPLGMAGLETGEELTTTDRFLHGFGLMTFYYLHKGMDAARLKDKQKALLRSVGFSEVQSRKFMRDHENINDIAIKAAVQPRSEKHRKIWTDNRTGEEVDFLRVEERKGMRPVVRYMDMKTHKTNSMPAKAFARKFGRDVAGENPKVFGVNAEYNKSKRTWTMQKTDKAGNVFGKQKVVKGVENRDKEISKFDKEIEKNKTDHRNYQKSAKVSESNLGLKDKDYKIIKEALYPDSKGSTINMDAAQLKEYADIVRNSKADDVADRPGMLFLENADSNVKGFLNSLSRNVMLPPVAYLRAAKMQNGQYSKNAREVSYILEDVRDIFAYEIGSYADLDLILKDMGFKPKEISELYGLVDPYFESFVPAKYKNHPMVEEAVKLIKATTSRTADKMAEAGVTVSIHTPTGKKTVPMWEAIDSNGDPIVLESYTGVSSLRKGEVVTDINGKRKRIKEITHNHIKEDYVHRIITDDARTLFNKNKGFREAVIEKMMKKTKKGKYIDSDAETNRLEGKTDREIYEAMKDKFNAVAGWIDEYGIYGRQYARVVDLPPEMAFDSKGREIPLDAFNKYKKGDAVEGRTIDQIVKMYDMDLRKSLARYGNKAAHVIAVTKTYGDKGIKGDKAQKMLTDVELDLGKDVKHYLEGILEEQIHGPKVPKDPTLQGILTAEKYVTTAVANSYLSWPTAGLKNIYLGQKENLTTFGFLRTAKAWGHLAHTQTMANIFNDINPQFSRESKYRAARHEAALVGALEEGTHLLETAKVFKLWPSLMYQSEMANRITAVLAGKFAAEDALDVVLGRKTPMGAKMSKKHARHILEETFDLRNMDQIIERGHFNQGELETVMMRAHRTTQGSPTVEYMPRAWQNQFAKPLSLFYRMAFRVTENNYKNAIAPAMKGNIWPLVRHASLSLGSGASLLGLYYASTGKPERDQFKYMPNQVSNTALTGEILGALSNFFDDRATHIPAVIEYSKTLAGQLAFMLKAGRQAVMPDLPYEQLKELGLSDPEIEDLTSLVRATYFESLFRDGVIGTAEDLAPFFNRSLGIWKQHAQPHIARAKYVHDLQWIYNRDIAGLDGEKNTAYGAFDPKQAFFESIESLFYADSPLEEYKETGEKFEFIEKITPPGEYEQGIIGSILGVEPSKSYAEEKGRIFEAAVMLEAHNLMNYKMVKYGNIYSAVVHAIKNIKAKVTSMDPVPMRKDWDSGRVIESKYDVFKSFLSDEDQVEVERSRRLYEHQLIKWEDAIYDVEGKILDMANDLFEKKRVD